jgi:histidinol phosphatase-like enzyme (inositol monophosphatase family)
MLERLGTIKVTKISRLEFTNLLECAHDLADRSGQAILPHFRKPLQVDNKAEAGKFDPVTVADRAAERVIMKALRQSYPEHAIEGEEFGTQPGVGAGASPFRWVIDPIDGTRSFIMGLPTWGTLIGLMDGATPLLGMMDQPFTQERFWSTDKASFFRGPDGREKRLKTRSCTSLADATLSTTHPDLFAGGAEAKGFQKLRAKAKTTRYGGDCYAYCLLAAGHIDIIIEAGLKPYDVAALIPIIERAGGAITSWTGASCAQGGRVLACGDRTLHASVLAELASK